MPPSPGRGQTGKNPEEISAPSSPVEAAFSGKWLTRERLIWYPRVFLAFYLLFSAALLVSALRSPTGLTDYLDRPLGGDFSCYWIASSQAQAGDAAAVYNPSRFIAAQEAYFRVPSPFVWFYPPTFLLIVYPLALFPYLAALALWLAATGWPYLRVLRRIAPHPLTIGLALGFPGTFQNFSHGQNGFLSTALLGGGLLFLDRFPLAAGCLLGLLSYKPHLFALIPVALVAGRRWTALLASLGSAAVLALVSLLVLGSDVWLAFLKNLSLPMTLVKSELLPLNKMVTVFAAALQLGVGFSAALAIQGLVTLGTVLGVFWAWRRQNSYAVKASILTLAIFLVTPHAFAYDLALLALPLAWLGWEGQTRGWRRGEPVLLVLCWLTPFLAIIFTLLKVQLTPFILLTLFIFLLRSGETAAPADKPSV